MLPEIDIIGQEKLANSKVSIIGLGGLGSPCSIYMAASGVGNLNPVSYTHLTLPTNREV